MTKEAHTDSTPTVANSSSSPSDPAISSLSDPPEISPTAENPLPTAADPPSTTADPLPTVTKRNSSHSMARRPSRLWATGLLKKGKSLKPITPINGLSIPETYFYSSKPGKPQVIMSIWMRLFTPPTQSTTVERIIEMVKLAAAEHYRLCCSINPETKTYEPLAFNAAKLPLIVKVVERKSDEKTWEAVLRKELNTNFKLESNKPLWKIAIVVSPEKAKEYQAYLASKHERQESADPINNGSEEIDQSLTVTSTTQDSPCNYEKFEIAFSFHHCLGDGLSMWAFARTFMKFTDKCYWDVNVDLGLDKVVLADVPPPILDNLMNPGFFEILPAAFGMIGNAISKKRHRRYKGRKEVDQDDEVIGSYDDVDVIESVHENLDAKTEQNQRLTSTRFLFYNEDFVSTLRKNAKKEGTTIAAVLVVMALSAVRTAFSQVKKYKKKKFPARQGWVVTNSMRHLLPNSRLLYGADKQTDPSVNVFGGYAGSLANASLKLCDSHDFWERSRTVRRGIITSFRTSLTRLKFANYIYRRPKLFNFIKKRVQLEKLSRQFSVELANLGAWDAPTATPNAPEEDMRLRLDQYGGIINSSFDGARGLFTLGVITLGGNMSIMIAYDKTAVSETDANLFVSSFSNGLKKLQNPGKISVLNVRSVQDQ